MTWAGPGQGERVRRQWTVSGTTYTSTYAWSALGLSGYTSNGIGVPGAMSGVTSWIVRDPSGVPIAQRYSTGQEYYYLLDGQGDVAALEDPGTIQGAGDLCPTGNEAGLFGAPTAVWLANPLGQLQQVRDDDTKTHLGPGGFRAESSGVSAQRVAYRMGAVVHFCTPDEPDAGYEEGPCGGGCGGGHRRWRRRVRHLPAPPGDRGRARQRRPVR